MQPFPKEESKKKNDSITPKKRKRKQAASWSKQEIAFLREKVDPTNRLNNSWIEITDELRNKYPDGSEKTVAQVREKYQNSINPNITITERFTEMEDELLLNELKIHGKVFAQITKRCFKGRTRNQIKNRFYTILRKCLKGLKRDPKYEGGSKLEQEKIDYTKILVNKYLNDDKNQMKRDHLWRIITDNYVNYTPNNGTQNLILDKVKEIQISTLHPLAEIREEVRGQRLPSLPNGPQSATLPQLPPPHINSHNGLFNSNNRPAIYPLETSPFIPPGNSHLDYPPPFYEPSFSANANYYNSGVMSRVPTQIQPQIWSNCQIQSTLQSHHSINSGIPNLRPIYMQSPLIMPVVPMVFCQAGGGFTAMAGREIGEVMQNPEGGNMFREEDDQPPRNPSISQNITLEGSLNHTNMIAKSNGRVVQTALQSNGQFHIPNPQLPPPPYL